MLVSIDGVITPPEKATISIFDRGFLYGDGLFEVLRTWNGLPVDLDAHLARMAANTIGLAIDPNVKAFVRAALETAPGDWRIRIIQTRGQGGLTARFADVQNGHVIVILEPLGALSATTTAVFVEWDVPAHGGHKSLAYVDSLIARELAAARGAEQALRRGSDGSVVEGATANLFIVKHGPTPIVETPPLATGILPGITRGHVLTSCAALGLTVRERRLTVQEVTSADEIFMTSAVRGVVAVTRLEGLPVGDGVGLVTQKLASAYAERMTRATISV